jgi:hypothetical protein
MVNTPTTPAGWPELRRAAEQLELEIHLGGMEARDRWRALKPQLAALERKIAEAGNRAGHVIAKEIEELARTLRGLREGIDHPDP